MELISGLESFLRSHLASPSNSNLLVAVSGGPDSMALFEATNEVRLKLGAAVSVVHYNYRLQSRAAEAERLVRNRAADLGVDYVGASLRLPERFSDRSGSLEARAREIRYQFFQRLGEQLDATAILLAHHRADQVETVLLNAGRGAGLYGLAGMGEKGERAGLKLFRPLLDVAREKILSFVQQRGISYVEDPTNEDLVFARNQIRHQVLPAWDEAQPAPRKSIFALSDKATLENDFWDQYLQNNFKFWVWENEVQVDVDSFLAGHPAARRRLLHKLLRELVGAVRFSGDNIEDVGELFGGNKSGAGIDLPREMKAIREYERVALFRDLDSTGEEKLEIEQLSLSKNWQNCGRLIIENQADFEKAGFCSRVKKEFMESVVVRTWQRGDRILYDGRPRKLKEVFQDNAVPYRGRRLWPVVVREGEIIVLPGLAVRDGILQEGGVIIKFQPTTPEFDQLRSQEVTR